MKASDWFREKLRRYEDTPEFQTEGLILDINEQIVAHMKARGIKRSELAQALGVSRPWVTKMLNGNPNLTLKTLVRVGFALDLFVTVDFEPRRVVRWRSLESRALEPYGREGSAVMDCAVQETRGRDRTPR